MKSQSIKKKIFCGDSLYEYLMGVVCTGVLIAAIISSREPHSPGRDAFPSVAELFEKIAELREQAGPADSTEDQASSCFHARLDYAEWRLGRFKSRWTRDACREIEKLTNEVQEDLSAYKQGKDVFYEKKKPFLCGYWSRIDDTIQPFSVALPEGFDPSKRWPVIILLHGQGMFSPYQGKAYIAPEMIVAAPHGRGGMDYKFVGETDVLAVVDKVKHLFPIDEDRVYLSGNSMGGTGAWHLGTRFPDRFAAIFPVCGNTDVRVWADIWHWRTPKDSPQAWVRDFLRDDTGMVVYAGNLLNTAVVTLQGEEDPVVNRLHTERMVEALYKAGHESVVYHSLAFVTHGIGVDRVKALRPYTRIQRPEHVFYRTAWLKYDGAYWIRIRSIEKRLRFASVDGRVSWGGSRISIRAENLSALELYPHKAPLKGVLKSVVINRKKVKFDLDKPLIFIKSLKGKWEQEQLPVSTEKFPPKKSCEIEGPLEHAFMSRFLVVLPAEEAERASAPRCAAERFCRLWKKRFGNEPRIAQDSEVTDTDIADSNLILFGLGDENTLTARVIDSLPVAIEGENINLDGKIYSGPNAGFKLCYPNPLNPERYVVLIAGTTPESYSDINVRFGNWFDWVPYDYRSHFDYAVFDDMTVGRAPETFLVWGFFGEDWLLEEDLRFEGVTVWRESLKPRVYPEYSKTPEGLEQVYLDDVFPDSAGFAKEYLERSRTLDGDVLKIGGKSFERGLAFRFPGYAAFKTSDYARFRATVGIQWDGKTEPCADRKRFERAFFIVKGFSGAELFKSEEMRYRDSPLEIDIDISGESAITLKVSGGRSWLNTTAIWADARLEKR